MNTDARTLQLVADALSTIFQVVTAGGTFTLQGTGPLLDPFVISSTPLFSARLISSSGARYATGQGKTLEDALIQIADQWSKL